MPKSQSLKKEIEKLRDDSYYYGEGGKKYLSNSDVKYLLHELGQFRVPVKENENLAKGRLFHQLLLEPMKAKSFPFFEGSIRNSTYKVFLQENGLDFALKKSEVDEVKEMAEWFMDSSNTKTKGLRDYIFEFGAKHEEPMIKELHGHLFKGKADIVTDNFVIDIKTTQNIFKLQYNASDFFYDSQAYIYQHLFNLPVVFFAIGKTKKRYGTLDEDYYDVGIFNPTPEFLQRGREKVEVAVEHYNDYFSKDKTKSLKDIVLKVDLK